MKKLIYSLFSILLVLFMLEATWDFLIRENKNIKLSYAVQGGLAPEILFHGPCEPLFTISPSYLDSITGIKSYNYALKHTDFADNYLHLYLYLKHNTPPKQLYLYVTPESFDLRFNTFHTFRFAAWLSDSLVNEVVKEMDPDYHSYSFLPFVKYAYYNSYKTFDAIQGFKHWLTHSKTPYFTDGHVPHEPTIYALEQDGFIAPTELTFANGNQVTRQENGKMFYEIYDSAQVFTWNETREKYLRKIISLAQEKGVEVILYESTPYLGSIINQPNRQLFLKRTRQIGREYGVNYLLYDALPLGKNKLNFVCPLILGEEGGKKFMDELAKTIKN